jgi:hypothetical protein
VRASGQVVRGREEVASDAEELLQEADFDYGSSDDESVSSYSDRWVPGSGMPGSFCLVVGPFGPLVPVVSVEGGPRAAAVFATVFLLILEPSSSADFGRRSKHPAGFRMAASAYSNEQWAHMRQLAAPAAPPVVVEDIDRRPKWESTRPTLKKEWSKAISAMKRKVSALTEANESALFKASQFPSSLLLVEADLKGKKPFKDATLRTNVAGSCGLALVRCGEMGFSSLGKESTIMSRLHNAEIPPRMRSPSSRSLRTRGRILWRPQRPWEGR